MIYKWLAMIVVASAGLCAFSTKKAADAWKEHHDNNPVPAVAPAGKSIPAPSPLEMPIGGLSLPVLKHC